MVTHHPAWHGWCDMLKSRQSKAFVLRELGYKGLKKSILSLPELGNRQILLQLKAVSLNFRDLKILRGHYARPPTLPITFLSDGAGKIVDVGSNVQRFSIGDRAMPIYMSGWYDGPLSNRHAGWRALGGDVDGVATQYAIFNEEDMLPIPNCLSYEQAACVPCAGGTAWHALVSAGNVKAGDTVVTLGSGGVSVFSLQIAKMHGARVIAISSSDSKIKRLLDIGAWRGINYKKKPNWGEKVLEITQGRGVDHVVEVGGKYTIEQSLRSTRNGGTIEIIGDLSGAYDSSEFTERDIYLFNLKFT